MDNRVGGGRRNYFWLRRLFLLFDYHRSKLTRAESGGGL
jgi:hypothetical protein